MKLFKRKPKEQHVTTCPRCSQLIEHGALECPMCWLDLRETYDPTERDGAAVRSADR